MRVHHVALRVADCERAAAFYSALVDLPELRRSHEGGTLRAVWLDAGGTILMLERELRGSGAASGSGHLLAFSVADLAESEQRLRRAGVAIEERTEKTLYVRDPDGHRVGFTVFDRA